MIKLSQKKVHTGTHVHFTRGGKHYVASWNDKGELVVFEASRDGEISNYYGVYDMWTNAVQHLFD